MRRYSCGKRQYSSQAAALRAYDAIAKVRAERPGFVPGHRQAYRCPHCNQWHLTSRAYVPTDRPGQVRA